MTEAEKTLRLENIQLRKQAHSYKSLLARALAKQQELEDQIEVLKAKVAELQKRLFGRKRERGCSSEAWLAKRGPRRCRGQQGGTRGHGRQPRTTLPREEVVVQAPEGQRICPHCGLPFEAAGTQGAHLASCALAQVSRQLPNQWQKRYGYCPVWLESLVEKDRFEATCYKAANWQCLGLTKGRDKLEITGQPALPVKWVFVYPLCADFIARLNG